MSKNEIEWYNPNRLLSYNALISIVLSPRGNGKSYSAKERIIKEWTSYLPSKYLYENYNLNTAHKLHTLELDYLSHGGELSNSRLEWAKENIKEYCKKEVAPVYKYGGRGKKGKPQQVVLDELDDYEGNYYYGRW